MDMDSLRIIKSSADDEEEECSRRADQISPKPFLQQSPSLISASAGKNLSSHSLTTIAITAPSLSSLPQQDLHHPSINPQVHRKEKVWYGVDYMLKLAHLSAFGILGVLIRCGLGIYFGDILTVIDNNNIPLYEDLPVNLVGSFMMGWLGIVWREDISKLFSEHVAVGLSTGLLGSMTTFSSWNQRMVELATLGKWPSALLGYIIGMGLIQMSLLVGIKSGKALKGFMTHYYGQTNLVIVGNMEVKKLSWKMHGYCKMHYMVIHLVGLLMGVSAWMGAVLLTLIDKDNRRNNVWLACVVSPFGVWLRWYLEDFNGKVFFTPQIQWFPMGTFLANLIAVSLEAAMGTTSLAVKNLNLIPLSRSFQIGFTGCLSSVSVFVAEIHMTYVEESKKKAFTYVMATLLSAMLLGISIYSIPAWVEGW